MNIKSPKRELAAERHGIKLYHADKPEFLIQEFTGNGSDPGKRRAKKITIGSLRNEISSYLLEYLEGFHIPTYFIRKESETEMLVKKVEMFPLIVRVFNYSAEHLPKRLGVPEQTALEFPVIEHYLSSTSPVHLVNEYHVFALGMMSPDEFKQINRIASKVNAVLRSLCARRRLLLASLKLEFGRHHGQIYLSEELSPVTCVFWDDTPPQQSTLRTPFASEESIERYAELFDRLSLKI